jgi:signal transduction histidine kinase
MSVEKNGTTLLQVPVDRATARAYPWWGLLIGLGLGVFLWHPLSMVVLNVHQYVYGRAALHVGRAIFMGFQPSMWPMILLYATSGAVIGSFIGVILKKLKEHRQRLDIFHQEFELQVATLRHHYKNLALGIRGFSSRIKRKMTDLEQKVGACVLEDSTFKEFHEELQSLLNNLDILDDAAQRLTQTLGQELLFLRALTSESLVPQTEDIYPLLAASIQDLKSLRFRDKDLKVTINGQPFEVCQDSLIFAFEPYSLEVILHNLLGNAMKFSDRVDIAVQKKGGWVRVAVQDNGPGLKVEELRRYLATPGNRREAESTHLGLKVTLHLLQKIGGELLVRSQPGAGATFIIQIPKEPLQKETE